MDHLGFLDKDVVADFDAMVDRAIWHADEERAYALIAYLSDLEGVQKRTDMAHLQVWQVVEVEAGTEVLTYTLHLAAVGSCQCVYTFVFDTDSQTLAVRAVWYGYRPVPVLYTQVHSVLDARILAHAARL